MNYRMSVPVKYCRGEFESPRQFTSHVKLNLVKKLISTKYPFTQPLIHVKAHSG